MWWNHLSILTFLWYHIKLYFSFSCSNKCIESRRSSKPTLHKIKYGEKRFSIWRMELWNYYTLQCGMWLWNHDSYSQVAAPCNVKGGSGMTCHGIRPNGRRIGILHLVSILTISPQSTCHSAPVCEILSKSDHPQQKKMMSCRFSRWRISAILDFSGPIMGSLKSPCTTSYDRQ